MGLGKFVWVAWFILFSTGVEASEVCRRVSTALAAPPVQYRLMEKFPAALEDVLPDYDRTKEVLFTFNYHHTSLYFGKYFADLGGNRENPKAIAATVVVKIHVGEDYVRRLEDAHPTLEMKVGNCEMRSLYQLQEQGIYLKGFVPLTAISLFELATRDGFVDANGKPFAHEVYALRSGNGDPIAETEAYNRISHVNALTRWLEFFGLAPLEFQGLVDNATPDPELREAARMMIAAKEDFTQKQRDFYLEVLLRAEQKFVRRMEGAAGTTHNALAWAMQNGYPHEHVDPQLKQVVAEALSEVSLTRQP